MPRRDKTFTAIDVIRIFQIHLPIQHKRAVLLYFWSLHPSLGIKKNQFVEEVRKLAEKIPGLGQFVHVFNLTVDIGRAIIQAVDLFKGEIPGFSEELVERDAEIKLLSEEIRECLDRERRLKDLQAGSETTIRDLRNDIDFERSLRQRAEEELKSVVTPESVVTTTVVEVPVPVPGPERVVTIERTTQSCQRLGQEVIRIVDGLALRPVPMNVAQQDRLIRSLRQVYQLAVDVIS